MLLRFASAVQCLSFFLFSFFFFLSFFKISSDSVKLFCFDFAGQVSSSADANPSSYIAWLDISSELFVGKLPDEHRSELCAWASKVIRKSPPENELTLSQHHKAKLRYFNQDCRGLFQVMLKMDNTSQDLKTKHRNKSQEQSKIWRKKNGQVFKIVRTSWSSKFLKNDQGSPGRNVRTLRSRLLMLGESQTSGTACNKHISRLLENHCMTALHHGMLLVRQWTVRSLFKPFILSSSSSSFVTFLPWTHCHQLQAGVEWWSFSKWEPQLSSPWWVSGKLVQKTSQTYECQQCWEFYFDFWFLLKLKE